MNQNLKCSNCAKKADSLKSILKNKVNSLTGNWNGFLKKQIIIRDDGLVGKMITITT
jgi:hypothetical protein